MDSLLTSLMLFPSFEHHRLYAGPYGHVVQAAAVDVVTEVPYQRLNGIEVGWVHFEEDIAVDVLTDDMSMEWEPTGSAQPVMARLFVDTDGTVRVDRLQAETGLFGLRSRPLLGDMFEFNVLGGYSETTALAVDTGRAQLRMLVPSELTLLGFSNTDFDADDRLKYYLSAGTGVGGDVLTQVLGRVGLYGRAVGFARTLNRHQGGAPNQVRHEIVGEAELGLAVFGQNQAIWLSGWAELITQWETRDAGGKDGLDRQYGAWGIRLNGRFHPDRAEKDDDDGERRGFNPDTLL